MFERLSRAAEQTAASVSRRQFLDWLGTGAAVLAATLGGVLAQRAVAARPQPKRCAYGYSQINCAGANVGDRCGYHRYCVAVQDLGGGFYACNCFSRNPHGL